MARHDELALSPQSAALEKQRETIVLVRWALILTCAYLMLLGKDTPDSLAKKMQDALQP